MTKAQFMTVINLTVCACVDVFKDFVASENKNHLKQFWDTDEVLLLFPTFVSKPRVIFLKK